MKTLAEAVANARDRNEVGRSGSIELVAGNAIAAVKAREFQVGFQAVVSEPNAQLIAGQLLAGGLQFGTVGDGVSERRGDVRVRKVAEGLGLVGQFEVEDAGGEIKVGANDLAELIFGLFKGVFGLDNAYTTRCDLGFRAVNIERWKRAEAEGLFIVVVAFLGFFERLALDDQGFAGEDDAPIISDGSQDDVIHFALKGSTSLLQIALRDQNWRAVGKESKVSKKRLGNCELESSGNGGVNQVLGIIIGYFACVEGGLKVGARLKSLRKSNDRRLDKLVGNRTA